MLSLSPGCRAAKDRSHHAADYFPSHLTSDRAHRAFAEGVQQCPNFGFATLRSRLSPPGLRFRCARLEHFVGRFSVDDSFIVAIECRLLHDSLTLTGCQRRQLALWRVDQRAVDDARLALFVEQRDQGLANG